MLRLCVFAVLLLSVYGGLLGAKKCTWGPSYWCQNFEQADECGATQHCHEKVWTKKEPSLLSAVSSVTVEEDACTYCKDIVADVRNFLESNKTQATIMQYMNRACDFLPDEFSMNECKKIEQHYMDQFEQCVRDNVDPDKLCHLMRLCRSSPQTVAQQPSKVSQVELKSSALSLRGKDGELCEPCKSAVAEAKKEIDDPKIQEAAKNMLMNECKQLGGDLVSECEMLVTMLMPEAIKFLDQELTDELCVTLGLCTNSTTAAITAITQSVEKAKTRLRAALRTDAVRNAMQQVSVHTGANACDTCEMVIGYVKIFLSNNETEQELAQLLENDVCPKLGEFADLCKTGVEQYLPQLYSLLLQELDPAKLCTDIGLCNSTSASPAVTHTAVQVAQVKVRAEASPQCILCEFVIDKLESMLSDNATEDEIIHAVEKVCSILPSSVRAECDQLIEKYGDAIIHLILNDVTASTICSFMGLCASGDSMYKKPLPLGSGACTVCEMALNYIQSLLEKDSTQQEVVHLVEKVCNYLSGDAAQECNSLVDQYGPAIIQFIAQDMKPEAVCTTLGLCKADVMKVDGLVHLYNSANV